MTEQHSGHLHDLKCGPGISANTANVVEITGYCCRAGTTTVQLYMSADEMRAAATVLTEAARAMDLGLDRVVQRPRVRGEWTVTFPDGVKV